VVDDGSADDTAEIAKVAGAGLVEMSYLMYKGKLDTMGD
jgi:glycosyltransferase involved in cell wall biosynthesis